MKKARRIFINIFLFSILLGCGGDTDTKQNEQETDKIENVGDAASKLGYNGEKIKDDLRDLQDLKGDQDQAVEEILNE